MKVKDFIVNEYSSIQLYDSVEKVRKIVIKQKFAIVKNCKGEHQGILTIEDIAEKNKHIVIDCMKVRPILSTETHIEKAFEIMEAENASALEVVENGHFKGVILKNTISSYLKNKNLELDKLVRKKTKELVESKENAETANRAKSEFLSNVSHEIRTPLNAILGFIEILLSEEKDKEKKEFIRLIKISSEQLLNIVNDILCISTIEAGKYFIEEKPVHIKRVLNTISTIYQKQAELKGIDFIYKIEDKIPNEIFSDEKSILKILNNLLSNAIKFTEKGSVSFIAKSNNISEGKKLEIIVKDTGIGISKAKQEKLFEPFEQGEQSISKKYGGTGLGLSIVKKMIDLLNGEISVKTEDGKGSEIKCEIPYKLVKTRLNRETVAKENIRVQKKLRIISAEDNYINQILLDNMIKDYDWEIKHVNNGKELLEELKKASYDIILMDIQMPVLDGIEATRIIRIENKDTKTPIISVSAYVSEKETNNFIEAGMNDYILKPYKKSVLVDKINKWAKLLKQNDDKV